MSDLTLVNALQPLIDRISTRTCWVRKPDGPRHLRKPLTPERLAQHVNGGPAYGAAAIKPGTAVTLVAVLDLDSHHGETDWEGMKVAALRVLVALEDRGLRPIPFRSSGGRGIHLYLLWELPQDAYSVRWLLRDALNAAGLESGTEGVAQGQVEIFPKQDSVPADGFGSMFILPLAGLSAPLDPFELELMPKAWAETMEWPLSAPVPVRERPVVVRSAVTGVDASLTQLRDALLAIPNDDGAALDYDTWRNVMFALHHATDGSDDGLALAHEFSARNSKYDPEFLEQRVWPYIKSDHGSERGPVTAATIFRLAHEHGYTGDIEDEFEALPPVSVDLPEQLPPFVRDKTGHILATLHNLSMALRRPDICGARIGFDTFRDELMLAAPNTDDWRAFADADYSRLRIGLERGGFRPIGREAMRDVVLLVGDDNRFDSAQLWLNTLQWDGTPRIERFLIDYFGAADTPYVRAVSMYLWTALAGRVMDPGCQADMALILIGAQGIGKTTGVRAIAPAPDQFVEIRLDDRDQDLSRTLRGKLVGELGELRGLATRESEDIKAWISRTHEEWIPKYREFSVTFPRRLVFIGTTNKDEFLADDTGNRRWLPVYAPRSTVEHIARDRLQLWAEARDSFALIGVDWQAAETLAKEVHANHMIHDAWEEVVAQWLDEPEFGNDTTPRMREFLRTGDVLQGALGFDAKGIAKRDEMRIGNVLHQLGFSRCYRRINGVGTKVWMRVDT